MKAPAALLALLLVASGPSADAHPAPNSILRLDFRADSVGAELLVPVSELGFATAAQPSVDTVAAYLMRHVAAETAGGEPWRVEITQVRATTYLEHEYFRAELTFAPPRGAAAGHFVLVSDVITHEIRNHVIFVVAEAELLGALQYPARRLDIRRPPATPASGAFRRPGERAALVGNALHEPIPRVDERRGAFAL